jgi:N4-gp56 family major capsid protein
MSNSVQALYQSSFIMNARKRYIYSQPPLAWVPPQGIIGQGNRGSSLKIPVYFKLLPATSALSQTADVTPVTSRDALITVTPDLYGNAVQLAEKLSLTAFTDQSAVATEQVGDNAAETVDYLARTQAIAGGVVIYGNDATSRATCGSADEIDTVDVLSAIAHLEAGQCPRIPGFDAAGYAAVIHPVTLMDFVEDAVVILMAEYGQKPEIILNGEVGMHMGGARLLKSNFAKRFIGAGADSGAMSSTTTLNGAVNAGATSIIVAADNGATAGEYLSIGTIESVANGENSEAETVLVTTGGSTTYTVTGAGPNGGLLYDHDSGEAVTDAYDVHATVFLGAQSLGMAHTNEDGMSRDPYLLPPEVTGLLKQFNSMGWKWFGGFGRIADSRLFRVEHTAARQIIGK